MNSLRSTVFALIPAAWRARARRMLRRLRRHEVVHVLHIGKTGGSAVKTALRPYQRRGRYDLELAWHHTLLRDVPRGERVVFFLRDPVDRFVSGFDNQKRGATPRYRHTWTVEEAAAFERFPTPTDLALALGSSDPEEREAAEAAMGAIDHVRRSFWDWFGDEAYFRSRLDDVFFVGFQETLEADFFELRELLGLPETIRLPSDDVEAHRRPEPPSPLPAEAEALIRRWYAADYDFVRLCAETVLDRAIPFDLEPAASTGV